jgi:GNAT superfamily N-acetyltransferase
MPCAFPLRVALRDETPAVVRKIVPGDATRLAEGLKRLSTESRVRRFFYDKGNFSDKELHNLTHCDGQSHLGFVLGVLDEDGNEVDTVAVARCIRNKKKPWEGEAAVVTIDAWQRLGIGTILLKELARACRDSGIHTWKVSQFANNCAVRKIMSEIGSQTYEREIGSGIVEAVYELRPIDKDTESECIPLPL